MFRLFCRIPSQTGHTIIDVVAVPSPSPEASPLGCRDRDVDNGATLQEQNSSDPNQESARLSNVLAAGDVA